MDLHHLSPYFSGLGGVGLYDVAPKTRSLAIVGVLTLDC